VSGGFPRGRTASADIIFRESTAPATIFSRTLRIVGNGGTNSLSPSGPCCPQRGRPWGLLVTPASVQDRDGGRELLGRLRGAVKRLQVVWADTAFAAALTWAWVQWGWLGEVVRKLAGQVGFVVQPKRWVVERTFGWLNRYRRLAKDYERTIPSSEAYITVSMIHLMARRLNP
jgi:transposase